MSIRCRFVILIIAALVAPSPPHVEAQTAPTSALPLMTTGRTHEETTTSTPGLTAATSRCPQADDPSYGTTAANPIKIGGAPLYIADRSVTFMRTLRGPGGEAVHFKRLGSFEGPDSTMLDVWLAERAGLSHHFYLDGYRTSDVRAPAGWLCGAEPRIDTRLTSSPSEASRHFFEVAAATFGPSVAPISIDTDGSAAHGVVFDNARLIGREVALAAAGQSVDPGNVTDPLRPPRFVVVAYPLPCAGRDPIRAQAIRVSDANGQSPRPLRETGGTGIRDLVPGFDVPGASLALAYAGNLAIPGQIEITYEESCGARSATQAFPVRGQGGRITKQIAGQTPTGFALPPGGMHVRVQVYFDHNGEPRFPAFAGGDGTLAEAAVSAVLQFRATPPTINGAPLLQPSTVVVAFRR